MLIIKQLIDYCFEPVALVYLDHTGDKNKSNKHIVPDILKQEEKAMQIKIGNKIKELRKRVKSIIGQFPKKIKSRMSKDQKYDGLLSL